MAVKVMVAPAIARGELHSVRPKRPASTPGEAKKPRRRRSSVYDADGNEVFLTLKCLKCDRMRPLSQFGLRRMADGSIRNQPWCRTCRTGISPKASRESLDSEALVQPAADPAAATLPLAREPKADPGTLAAQVATALYRGRG